MTDRNVNPVGFERHWPDLYFITETCQDIPIVVDKFGLICGINIGTTCPIPGADCTR